MPYNSYPIYTNNDMGEQLPTIVKTTDGIFHAFFNKKQDLLVENYIPHNQLIMDKLSLLLFKYWKNVQINFNE